MSFRVVLPSLDMAVLFFKSFNLFYREVKGFLKIANCVSFHNFINMVGSFVDFGCEDTDNVVLYLTQRRFTSLLLQSILFDGSDWKDSQTPPASAQIGRASCRERV